MPNWKKLITSGSAASLSSLQVTGNTGHTGSINFKDDINLTYNTNGDNIGIGLNTEHTGSGFNSIAIGYVAKANHPQGIGIGYSSQAGKESAAIGYDVKSDGTGSVAIGYGSEIRRGNTGAVALGYGGEVNASYAHVYGGGTVTGRNTHLFGSGVTTSETYKLIAGNLDLWASGSSRGNMYIMGSGSIGTSLDVGTDITVAGKVGAATNDEYLDFGTDAMIKVSIDNVEDFRFADGGTFHANADIVAYSSTVSSDERLKTNIVDTKYGLDHILKLESKEFDWKEKLNGRHDIGFIAQQVQEVVPELVKEVDGLNGEDPHLTVDYAKVVPILVNAIKELKDEINELKIK